MISGRLGIVWLLWIGIRYSLSVGEFRIGEDADARRLAADPAKCVKWGNTFDVSLTSKNVVRPCSLPDGRPICCSATEPVSSDLFAKGVGVNYRTSSRSSGSSKRQDEKCVLTKQYYSSPHEIRELEASKLISKISGDHTDPKRLKALVDYVYSEESLRNASFWLDRVKLHMSSEETPQGHPHDVEFLSRFEFTRTCGNVVEKWTEWIEPITIPARHPHSFGVCRPVKPLISDASPRTGRSNVDYVLLQSGKSLHRQNYFENGRRVSYGNETDALSKRSKQPPPKHFLLDSGTSTFDSSLFWFTCGYAQVIPLSP